MTAIMSAPPALAGRKFNLFSPAARADRQLNNTSGGETMKKTQDDILKWVDEDLAKSGLTRQDMEVQPFMNEKYLDQTVSGYKILFRYPDGAAMRDRRNHEFFRMRFRPPLPVGASGERMKYGVAVGAGNHCYIPADVHGYLMENLSAPLFLTEGEKKAVKATKSGIPTIGLPGIWNWLASKDERREAGSEHKIHEDLTPYLSGGRDVYLIYDSDSRDGRRKAGQFTRNAIYLAAELDKSGCRLFRVDVPQESEDEKTGLDDYLLDHTAEMFLAHVNETRELIDPQLALQFADPYREITEEFGPPFEVKYTKEGTISKVIYNQTWNARFLATRHQLLFEPDEGNFYRYEESRGIWQQITEKRVIALLNDDLKDYWRAYHPAEWRSLMLHCTNNSFKQTTEMLRGIVEKRDAFRRIPERRLIHLQNGMLDLEEMVIKDFDPKYHSRNQIPLEFDPEADCPRFLNELLAPALGNEAIEAFQKYAGMTLLGGNDAQQFMLLEGTAGGGKGTLVELLKKVIGEENIAELRTMHANDRFEFSGYVGKTLLIGADVPGNFLQQCGSESIKKLTGGDLLDAEFKHANGRSKLRGEFSIVITSNNSLHVRLDGDNDAWRRRLILLRFRNAPPTKPIARFAETLFRDEGKGILNWMVQGAAKYLDDLEKFGRIHLGTLLQNDADDLLYKSDSVHNFVADCVRQSDGGTIISQDAYLPYVNYCGENGYVTVTRERFFASFKKEMERSFNARCAHNTGPNRSNRGYKNFSLI